MNRVKQRAANHNDFPFDVQDVVAKLEKVVAAQLGDSVAFAEAEASLLAVANEAIRTVLERRLQRAADGFGRDVLINGLAYRRHQAGTKLYFSLCGPLKVKRWTYRLVGERNGPTEVAVERWAGLVEGATPALAYCLAQGYAKAPIRSVEQDLHAAHRAPPSRSTLDRLARAIGTEVKKHEERIENIVRKTEQVPDEAVAVNLGLDRTTVPMAETEKGKCVVRYRMAYVGTVCITGRDAKPLCTRRYAVSAHRGPASIIRRMMADLRETLKQKPELKIGIVQDGAPELWGLIREAFNGHPDLRHQPKRETYDFYHLMEYLARVLDVLAKDQSEKEELLAVWRNALLHRDNAVKQIDDWIEHRGFSFPLTSKKRRDFIQVKGMYLVDHRHFRYASLKRLGLQKGSGVTEGACKSLVGMRAKRSGQRWLAPGIDAVFALKSFVDSERFPAFWTIFADRYAARCEAA